ncbi:uncharacterized protein LOC21404914 [Morus notabilis]|nr:uncharacterized protein LOC21404914 [Morus notabilis]
MEGKTVDSISLKAVVDEKRNKLVFVESDDEFVDVLFSFLTMSLGTIIRLAQERSMPLTMGCVNNLYESVKNMDLHHFHFHSEAGKLMFSSPRSEAENNCMNLKLKIDNTDNTERKLFTCRLHCGNYSYSHYRDVFCKCGRPMNRELLITKSVVRKREGVFVNGMARFIISDGLQVMHMSSLESFSLLAKHDITDHMCNAHERTFNVGTEEVLNLLICSLQSRTPLTEVFLKNKGDLPDVNKNSPSLNRDELTNQIKEEDMQEKDEKISVKLMISKSKKRVCYAEAKKDFVNLVLSFLTVPLGHIAGKLRDTNSFNGCIDQLYKSVKDLDEQLFKSNHHKEMLVSPSLAFGFSYKNDLLGIKSAPTNSEYHGLTPIDAKSHNTVDGKSDEGILTGVSTMFIVTDSLTVTPISSIFCMSILKEMKVPISDIEAQVVHVGKEEAVRLLLSSFVSESALTNTFIRDPNRKPSAR